MSHQWILYSTQGCHLCEQAVSVIQQLQGSFAIEYQIVDIADGEQAEQLIQRFGERIPVLENTQLQETLDWPFDIEKLTAWLSWFLAIRFKSY